MATTGVDAMPRATAGLRPMIKFAFAIRRRDGMAREEFQRCWREHADLWRRHADTLRIRRYVQAYTKDTDMDEGMAAARGSQARLYDGVEELWFDSLDALVAAFSSTAGQAAASELRDDEHRFIDLPNSPMWFAEEHVIIGS